MLQQLAKLLKALNSDSNPAQISLAFILGMILGFTPLWSLHNLLVLLLVCILRINLAGFLLAFGLFSGLAYLLDPLFIQCGQALLLNPDLKGFWTNLYQSDLWRLLRFNHTLTLGSLVVSLLLAIPLFFLFRFLIINYREHVMVWIEKSRLAKWLKASKFYSLYESVSGQGVLK